LLFELRKLRRDKLPPETAIQELDLEALSNLLDERQEKFVRAHLSPTGYRRYERGKSRVLLAYLRLMSAFLEARIRSLTASSAENSPGKEQLDLFIHARQLVLRAQILLWLSFLFPAGVRITQSAQEHCRALADSIRNELTVARNSLAS
jgi:transcriptional regulator with XRE-family HTH domain